MPMPESPSSSAAAPSGEPAGVPGPVYLLADSRPLFGSQRPGGPVGAPASGRSLAERLRADLEDRAAAGGEALAAAYLGASNGDEPAFYEIFEAAMDQLGVERRRFVRASPAAEDLDFLRRADLVLLAGGEVQAGWEALERSGAAEIVLAAYRRGAVLVGVSAGAVQLGQGWLPPDREQLFPTARLLPFLIDAHDEPEWRHLRRTVSGSPGYLAGLGIPFGGAARVAPDMTVEPLEKPLLELFRRPDSGAELQEALLAPAAEPDAGGAPPPSRPSAAGAAS